VGWGVVSLGHSCRGPEQPEMHRNEGGLLEGMEGQLAASCWSPHPTPPPPEVTVMVDEALTLCWVWRHRRVG